MSQDTDIVDDQNEEWIDDRSKAEVEFDNEQQRSYEHDLTKLRALKWLNELTSDPKEASVTIQDVDRDSMKYIKIERDYTSWGCPGRAITHSCIQPRFNIRYAIDGDLDGYFCPGSGGRT